MVAKNWSKDFTTSKNLIIIPHYLQVSVDYTQLRLNVVPTHETGGQPMESSLLALVGDFFIDVYFLHGLSTDTLIDVKNIHFEKGALIAMVFFEFTGKGS